MQPLSLIRRLVVALGYAWLASLPALGAVSRPAESRPVSTQPAAEGKWIRVYAGDFADKVGHEWSKRDTNITERGDLRFLGQFGRETVSLVLPNVPEHRYIRVTFELYIMRSWDGGHPQSGPDIWEMSIERGPTLIRSTFSNHTMPGHDRQSFPDPYPGGDYLAFTASAERNTLGYTFDFGVGRGEEKCDSTYRLSVLSPHGGGSLKLNFAGIGLEETDNESWGLRSVVVEITPDDLAAAYDAKRLDRLWKDLGGEPMTGFAAVWELMGAGDKAVTLIKERLAQPAAESQSPVEKQMVARLIADLDDPKYPVREKASQELLRLGPRVIPALREALASVKSEEVKGRIQDILTGVGKHGLGESDTARWVRAVRVLEMLGTNQAKDLLATLARKSPYLQVRRNAVESIKYLQTGERPEIRKPNGPGGTDGGVIDGQGGEQVIEIPAQDQS
jgi:hypothetical protein